MNNPETTRQQNPRAALEAALQGETVGSPKWLRIADAEVNLGRLLQNDRPSVTVQKVVATWAQIKETIRKRSFGPDAAAYNEAKTTINEIYASYWVIYNPDPDHEGYPQTRRTDLEIEIGTAVLADLQSMIEDQPL